MASSALALLLSLVFSLVLVPLIRRLSQRLGKMKIPSQDRWHRQSTPTMGGLAIFIAFILVVMLHSVIGEDGEAIPWGLLAGAGLV